MQITKEQEMQKICETLNTMGSVKIYSNDGNIEHLRFKVKKPFINNKKRQEGTYKGLSHYVMQNALCAAFYSAAKLAETFSVIIGNYSALGASTGQTLAQVPQSMQSSGSIEYFSPSDIAP